MIKEEIKISPIKDSFIKYGFRYTLLDSHENRRLYKQEDLEDQDLYYYEVIYLRPVKGTSYFKYPSSSQWGKYGKTFSKGQYEKAVRYLKEGW